jgi:hypothetical protein
MRKSPRLPKLILRLKKLKLKYKIFYGIKNTNKNNFRKIYSIYNREKVVKRTGRDMGFNEIGSQYTVFRIFKYALKKKLKNIIILNDDAYPSELIKEWIEKKIYFNGKKFIGFMCFPPGLLKKKPIISLLDNKIKIFEAKTHLFNTGFMQITLGAIKKYMKITKGKVIGNGDYPFNFKKNNITLLQVFPFLVYPDDKGFSFLASDRLKLEKTELRNIRKNLFNTYGIAFVNTIFNFFRYPYYILFIPFILRKYKDYDYYIEYYFEKYFYKLINPIFKRYIDIENIYYLKSSYAKDLKKYAHHRV